MSNERRAQAIALAVSLHCYVSQLDHLTQVEQTIDAASYDSLLTVDDDERAPAILLQRQNLNEVNVRHDTPYNLDQVQKSRIDIPILLQRHLYYSCLLKRWSRPHCLRLLLLPTVEIF